MYIDYSSWESFEYKISTLQLDVNNPRIRYSNINLNQTQIMKLLIENEKIYELAKKISQIFADKTCGNVHRIKGIIRTSADDGYEINSTSYEIKVNEVHVERPVLIIIGEELSK